ncbi:hypothetical protein HZB60_06140 [candidate division KSB1 bacterium]|nr:hypothetical protein [candidate division KSB1 bacterium]
MRWRFPAYTLVVSTLVFASERAMLPVPHGYPTESVDGKAYYRGKLYVARGFSADSLLTPLGVRELTLDQSTSQWGKYAARWPVALQPDSFPPQVVGIDYDQEFDPPIHKRYVVAGGKFHPAIISDGSGFTRVEGYHRFMQVFPPEADTVCVSAPYVKGTIFLYEDCDTEPLRALGFARLQRQHPRGPDPTLEDLIDNPEWVKLVTDIEEGLAVFRTAWPIDLETANLSDCVVNLISDWHARGEMSTGKPFISVQPLD